MSIISTDGSTAEWVKVANDHAYRVDVVLGQVGHVLGVVEVGQDAAVDPRVQRLDPTPEHFRRARQRLDRRVGMPACPRAEAVPPLATSS